MQLNIYFTNSHSQNVVLLAIAQRMAEEPILHGEVYVPHSEHPAAASSVFDLRWIDEDPELEFDGHYEGGDVVAELRIDGIYSTYWFRRPGTDLDLYEVPG